MKETIKHYLEEMCNTDSVLFEKYDEAQLDGCMKYLYDKASDLNKDHKECIAVDDGTVFNWARHYFIEGQAAIDAEREAKAEEERIKRELEAEERRKAEEERKAKEEAEKAAKELYEREHANGQMTIFDLGA